MIYIQQESDRRKVFALRPKFIEFPGCFIGFVYKQNAMNMIGHNHKFVYLNIRMKQRNFFKIIIGNFTNFCFLQRRDTWRLLNILILKNICGFDSAKILMTHLCTYSYEIYAIGAVIPIG